MLNKLSETEMIEVETQTLRERKPEEFRRMELWLNEQIAAGKKRPHSTVVTLTPVLASLLLERNPKNRPLTATNIMELSADAANGRFVFNGESIIVSDSGILNDGQHRCKIVVSTGVAIETVIVFGPKEDTRFTVDTGRSKTVANFLSMQGRTYTKAFGAAVGYYLQWNDTNSIPNGGTNRPTKQQILAAAAELPGFDASVEFTAGATKTVRSHAVIAFCHYVFWKKSRASRADADEFVMRLIDGEGLRRGSPILYARNRLLNMGRLTAPGARAELLFRCWNAWRAGHGVERCTLTGKLPKLERGGR